MNRPQLEAISKARRARTTRNARYFGRLTAGDYRSLLRDLKAARSSRDELAREVSRKGSKVARLLNEHGACWWGFYELSYPKHIAIVCYYMGWTEKLKEIAAAENPSREFLRFAADDDEDGENPFLAMDAPVQAAVVNLLIGLLYSVDSIRHYGLSINELLGKARAGDLDAFLRAASIDRTMVLTPTGASLLASAQLGGDRRFFTALLKRSKPHDSRAYYGDLRFISRVMDETNALKSCTGDELLTLVGDELGLYSTKSGDPVKGLLDRLRDWKQEATR